MRLAVCTLWTPEIAEYARLTMKNKRAYCQKWGYDFIERSDTFDSSRPASWSKLLLIQEVLPRYDWVFWTDADSLFMRDDIPLAGFLDEAADLIWSEDCNGPNAGQFFLRRCDAALELLRVAHARRDLTHHPWWDQDALRQTLEGSSVAIRVKLVPLTDFNSHESTYAEGQLVIHLAGRRDKFADVRRYARRLGLTE